MSLQLIFQINEIRTAQSCTVKLISDLIGLVDDGSDAQFYEGWLAASDVLLNDQHRHRHQDEVALRTCSKLSVSRSMTLLAATAVASAKSAAGMERESLIVLDVETSLMDEGKEELSRERNGKNRVWTSTSLARLSSFATYAYISPRSHAFTLIVSDYCNSVQSKILLISRSQRLHRGQRGPRPLDSSAVHPKRWTDDSG